MTNEEKAEFFDSRRGDLSIWSEKPAKAKVRRPGSIVFSVRFSREELEALRAKAEANDLTISEFIRRAALEYQIGAALIVDAWPTYVAPPMAWQLWEIQTGAPTEGTPVEREEQAETFLFSPSH